MSNCSFRFFIMRVQIIGTLLLFLCSYSAYAGVNDTLFEIKYKPNVIKYWKKYNEISNYNLYEPSSTEIDRLNKGLIEMFSILEPFNEHLMMLAWTYHMKKDYRKAVQYYYSAVSKGYQPYCSNTQPSFILDNKEIPEYKIVLNKLDSMSLHPSCRMDITFCNLVNELITIDQFTRNMDFFKKDSTAKLDSGFQNRYILFYDEIIIKRLLKHIEKFGIPHQNLMTFEAYESFKILIHHQVQNTNNPKSVKLFRLVKNAIEDGRLNNKFLKAAIDYMFWKEDKQYFGTTSQRNLDGKYELNPPIIDPVNIDDRRSKWLFEPLYIQMQNNYDSNFVLPSDYKPLK